MELIKTLKNSIGIILLLLAIASCTKSVELCSTFDDDIYAISDTIYASASCSINGEQYLWEPAEGLTMIGSGSGASERFIVTSLTPFSGFRTIVLTVSNSKSSRTQTKSLVIVP